MKQTLYELLGVAPKATTQEIIVCYQDLKQQCEEHPEDIESENRLKAAQYAYHTLRDAKQRASYDRTLREEKAELTPESGEAGFPLKWLLLLTSVIAVGSIVYHQWSKPPGSPERTMSQSVPPLTGAGKGSDPPARRPTELKPATQGATLGAPDGVNRAADRLSLPRETSAKPAVPRVTQAHSATAQKLSGHWICDGRTSANVRASYDFGADGTFTAKGNRTGKPMPDITGRYRLVSESLMILASDQTTPRETPVRILELSPTRLVVEYSQGERFSRRCSR